MNKEKLEEFSKITASIGSVIDGLLKTQELLVNLMCKECGIPYGMKGKIIEDMNKVMGIKAIKVKDE